MPFIWDQLTYLQILCLSENGEKIVHVQHTELQRYLWKRTELELNFSEKASQCTSYVKPHTTHIFICSGLALT